MNKILKTVFVTLLIIMVGTVVYIIAKDSGKSTNQNSSDTSNSNSNSSNTSTTTNNSSKCIITVDGDKYDVTQFRNEHPGGNIFECGTDMSTIFHGQHGQTEYQRLQQYRIE